ncbi:hypothetical protein M0R04_10235 [Candidatus Dojkabacteria bacterium]|jgi:hypothetical protein|nr:hypothetical protein [Candidatus Dojkabacteria bacterium]
MTIGALSYSHSKGTPVYILRWDKYSLEYKTTGSWAVYASMPATLRYDAINTEYRDATADSTYSWRYRYYSTENSAYSEYSDTISASGWDKNSVGYMVRQVRKIINDPDSKVVTDEELIRYFNEAQGKIYTLYDRWWFLYKSGTAIDTVASQKIYNLPSDFGRMSRVNYRYVSGSTDTVYNLKYMSNLEFEYLARDNSSSDDDNVGYYSIYPGDSDNTAGYLHVWPTPETAGLDIIPWYYKTVTDLDSYGDLTEVPIPSMLEDYAIAQVMDIKKEDAKADRYDRMFREQVELLKQLQRKQVGAGRRLWEYKGANPDSRLYGRNLGSDDSSKENFW